MNVIQIHLSFSQIVEPVKGWKILAHRRDQIVVDAVRNVVGKQCLPKGAVVSTGSGVINVFLNRAAQDGRQRIFVSGKLIVKLMESRFAHIAIGRDQELGKRTLRQFDFDSFFIFYRSEFQISVG